MNSLLVLILAVFVAVFALGLSGCSQEVSSSPPDPTPVTTSTIKSLSKAEINKMLSKLESRAEPTPKMGALCYSMASPPVRTEYICPLCGEKTLYTKIQTDMPDWEFQACQREFKILQKSTDLPLSLDESSYCAHCCPDAEKSQLILKITYSDGSTHEAILKYSDDLIMLREFLKGGLSFPTFNEGTEALKKHLPRLKELLGVDKGDQ